MALENHLTHNLNFLMQVKDLTANALSKSTGIRPATIYKLKDGVINNPTVETLYPIAKFFGLSIEELMDVKLYNLTQQLTTNYLHAHSLIPLVKIEEVELFPNAQIVRHINTDYPSTKTTFCIEVVEDNIKFEPGTILIIDKGLNYETKDYVLVKKTSDGSISIKKIIYDDEFFLQSITLGLESKVFGINGYDILGVIVGSIKYFKVTN